MAEFNPEFGASNMEWGQTIDATTGVAIPFVQFTAPYTQNAAGERVTGYEGQDNTEIQPKGDTEAQIRITDPDNALGAILDALVVSNATTIPSISFPPTLTGVTVTFNTNEGAGVDSHPADQQSFTVYGSGSGTLNPTSNSQGSASIIPDAQPIIEERFHENVDAMEYTIYGENGDTPSDIRGKLGTLISATILAWPQFKPKSITLTVQGQSASVSAKADTRVFAGGTTDSGSAGYEYGNAQSKETGVQTKSIRISPTLHGAITITGASDTATAAADADASTDIFAPGSLGEQPAIPNTKSVSVDVTGSVTPTSITATTPAAIPTSGLYARSITAGSQQFGIRTIYQIIVVDFANLTP